MLSARSRRGRHSATSSLQSKSLAGISVLIGFKTRWGAIALLLFTACTIIFAHNFWTMEGAARAANQVQALKNLAIMGGLLAFAVVGSGRYSMDDLVATRT